MNETTVPQGEFESETDELESGEFEFEFEGEGEFEFEGELESPNDEIEEMELAAELLAVSSEEELDQFLGKLFKKIGKGIKKVGRGLGKVAGPLGGLLKGLAKKALPFVGGALGSFIPIPGVGTAVGSALGTAASKLLEFEFEGMSSEDQEFELARRYVRLARTAATAASSMSPDTDPRAAAVRALQVAAQRLATSAETGSVGASRNGTQPGARSRRGRRTGRWYRSGNTIVVSGA